MTRCRPPSEEKGYGKDELNLKPVDLCVSSSSVERHSLTHPLAKGENFSPSFLRLNAKGSICITTPLAISYQHASSGTVPTLIVPLANTLAPDMESRYKAITDTEASPPRYASELWAEWRCIAGPDCLS
jgi:hypothetical protein